MAAVASLEALRARIREIEGTPVIRRRVSIGSEALDGALGGLSVPGLVELHGSAGSGRTRLGLAIAASFQRRGEAVAWVDVQQRLYPPSLAAHGVRSDGLLMIRPPVDRASWVVEQLARSGAFGLVVVQDPLLGGSAARQAGAPTDRRAGFQWDRAAEAGQCLILTITSSTVRSLPADLRIEVAGGELVVQRDRFRAPGGSVPLPPRPFEADPWA